jgi:ABC-type Mn2+/Zn2+ transport system permease subunit
MKRKILGIELWKLSLTFLSAVMLEITGVARIRFLVDRNSFGMAFMVFLNPFLCLLMSHYTIEAKTIKQRTLIAFAFALGFSAGAIISNLFFTDVMQK